MAAWALAIHVLQVSSKPAWCVQVPSGEAPARLSISFFIRLWEAGDAALHHPREDMGDRFRFGCPLNHSTPSVGPAAGAALQG